MQEVLEEIGRGRIVCIITDPSFIINDLVESVSKNFQDIRIILCEELEYTRPSGLFFGDITNPPVPISGMNILFVADQNNCLNYDQVIIVSSDGELELVDSKK